MRQGRDEVSVGRHVVQGADQRGLHDLACHVVRRLVDLASLDPDVATRQERRPG
jgi:hypothetical protein